MSHSGSARLEQLLKLLAQSDATELMVETAAWRLRASRLVGNEPRVEEPAEEKAKLAEPAPVVVRSPLVGYFEPRPKAVQVGQRVSAGEVLCMLVAMGLPNEVRSPAEGEVTQVFVEAGQPVEYGQPLFEIRQGKEDEAQ